MIQTERLPSLLSSFDKSSLRSFNIFAPIKCPGRSNADYEDDELIEADLRSYIWHVCDLHSRRKQASMTVDSEGWKLMGQLHQCMRRQADKSLLSQHQ